MRTKVIILTVLAIATMLIPTASALAAEQQFWHGTSQTTVAETLQVLGSATGSPLADGYTLSPITINRGETFTKSLWVKNTSATIDYTVTPVFNCDPVGAVTCVTSGAKAVNRGGQVVQFDFILTGVTAGTPYTVTLSFTHN